MNAMNVSSFQTYHYKIVIFWGKKCMAKPILYVVRAFLNGPIDTKVLSCLLIL